jgi:hypothetical protein
MLEVSIKFDIKGMERALLANVGEQARRRAIGTALTRVAVAAREEVKAQLPKVFDKPTPFTVGSVRYQPASEHSLVSGVYISDDANRGLSPRKYLGPEMRGGLRNNKGTERVLMNAGLMARAQQIVPSVKEPLDDFGNMPGSRFVTILSRLKAFDETGFLANASERTKKRLAKAKRAAATANKTDFFVGHSKRGGEPLGIWQLIGRGQVRPVLIFANRLPTYRPRFDLRKIVTDFASKHLKDEVVKALLEGIDKGYR